MVVSLNRTFFTSRFGGNYLPNMNFTGKYYKPKQEADMKQILIDFRDYTINQIKEYYANYGEDIEWVEPVGVSFNFAEGTEDVYKKMGLDVILDEYLARQQFEVVTWKILTNAHIDFKPGGIIEFGEHQFIIEGVVNAFSTGTTPNVFKFYKKAKYFSLDKINKFAPKLIILK